MDIMFFKVAFCLVTMLSLRQRRSKIYDIANYNPIYRSYAHGASDLSPEMSLYSRCDTAHVTFTSKTRKLNSHCSVDPH